MILQLTLLILGFAVLIKGADWLVNGSVSIAKRYNVSELAIGLTIVAFGTSAPELVVSIISSVKGLNDVTLGNIVGSNIFNLMLILGISGMFFPLSVQIKTIWNEIPISILAVVVLLILANFSFNINGILSINRLDGVILLIFFLLFLVYIYINLKSKTDSIETDYKKYTPKIAILLIFIGLISLIIGSKIVVENAVKIAQQFGASDKLIGITIVSAGTSLPELVTSVVAAFRRKSDLAIGNIIGSNIFNIFLILGVSSIIKPIDYNISFNFDIFLIGLSTLLLFIFMFSGKKYKLDRWEAAILFLGYLAYITYLIA